MAIYAVSKTNKDWDGAERFKYKNEAEVRFREIAATGHFVRIIRWNNYQATELDRANTPPTGSSPPPPVFERDNSPSPSATNENFAIFISYRRDDTAGYTGRLHDRLIQPFGREHVFMDIDAIPLGVDWAIYVKEKVGQCDVLLVVIGRAWLAIADAQGERRLENPADFVRLEIAAALERDIPVVPLLVGSAAMPRPRDLPESLRPLAFRMGMELHDSTFHSDVDHLIAEMERIKASRFRAPSPTGVPWRFEGVIRGEGQAHPDASERMYIAVRKRDAVGFPFREGERVEVELEIGGRIFVAGTRTTPSQEIVYIAADLRGIGGEKVALASALQSSGFQKGQRVILDVQETRVRVSPVPPGGAASQQASEGPRSHA